MNWFSCCTHDTTGTLCCLRSSVGEIMNSLCRRNSGHLACACAKWPCATSSNVSACDGGMQYLIREEREKKKKEKVVGGCADVHPLTHTKEKKIRQCTHHCLD